MLKVKWSARFQTEVALLVFWVVSRTSSGFSRTFVSTHHWEQALWIRTDGFGQGIQSNDFTITFLVSTSFQVYKQVVGVWMASTGSLTWILGPCGWYCLGNAVGPLRGMALHEEAHHSLPNLHFSLFAFVVEAVNSQLPAPATMPTACRPAVCHDGLLLL